MLCMLDIGAGSRPTHCFGFCTMKTTTALLKQLLPYPANLHLTTLPVPQPGYCVAGSYWSNGVAEALLKALPVLAAVRSPRVAW